MDGEDISRAAALEALLAEAIRLTDCEPDELTRAGQFHEKLCLERSYDLIWTLGARVNRAIGCKGRSVRGRKRQLKAPLLPGTERK